MDNDFNKFRELLTEALREIIFPYFATPVAGQDDEIARERLFCYELYHQLRCVCDANEFGYWLGGELDKSGHPIIRGDLKPDLVVHEPGDMDRNLCVIEVKPIDGSKSGFKKDIKSLTTFVKEYSYHACILLVFGNSEDAQSVIRRKINCDPDILREKNIFVFWINHAQGPLVEL